MGIDRDTLRHVHELLRPLRNRIANGLVRAAVMLTNDGKKLQRLQIDGFEGGPIDDAEHFQSYGFSSVPLAGAEAIAFSPNGDRERLIVVAVSDRRHRPIGGQPGEVTVYNNTGASITLTKDGDVKARAAPGRDVLVDDGSGAVEPVVKRSEFLQHGHVIVATGAVSPCAGPVVGALPAGSAVTFPGTATLQVK